MNTDPDIRKIVFSSSDFWGYTVIVDLGQISSLSELEGICTASLFQTLANHNFQVLLERARGREFHIHEGSLDRIRGLNPASVIYICDHCGGNVNHNEIIP